MDCGLVLVGRFLAVLLLCVQCGFLTAFPVWYRDDKRLILLLLLFSPTLIYNGFWLPSARELREVFRTWVLYICFGLIPYIDRFCVVRRRTRQEQFPQPDRFESDPVHHACCLSHSGEYSERFGQTRRLQNPGVDAVSSDNNRSCR